MDITRAMANYLRQSDFALADALWLLRGEVVQMHDFQGKLPDKTEPEHSTYGLPKPSPVISPLTSEPEPEPEPVVLSPQPEPVKPPPKPDPIYLTTSARSDWRFRAPGARALPEAPQLARALRLLRKRVASRQIKVMDEAASVEHSAELRCSSAVFVPARERWLTLVILADESAGMAIWQDTIKELRKMCERASVFADVRLWRLDPQQQRIRAMHNCAPRTLRELNHSEGRQIIWVASSGIGSVWRDSNWLGTLRDLADQQPLALLQLLPERLWQRSAIVRQQASIPCYVGATTAAVTNRHYRLEASHGYQQAQIEGSKASSNSDNPEGLKLPLLGLDASLMRAYAKLIAVGGVPDLPGLYIALTNDPPITRLALNPDAALKAMSIEDARERIMRFKAGASATAFELLQLLSGLPLQIPIMRLVQAALQAGRSGHGELAEVLYSGLIRRVSPATVQDPNQVEYNFFEPLRETLASETSLKQTLDVVDVLGEYLKQRHGHDYDFMAGAIIKDAPEKELTFAEVRGHLSRRLDFFRAAAQVEFAPQPLQPNVGVLQGKNILWLKSKPGIGHSHWLGAKVYSCTSVNQAREDLHASRFDALVFDLNSDPNIQRERLKLLDELDQHGPFLAVVMQMRGRLDLSLEAENFGALVCAPSSAAMKTVVAGAMAETVSRDQLGGVWPNRVYARLDNPQDEFNSLNPKTAEALEGLLLDLAQRDGASTIINSVLNTLIGVPVIFSFSKVAEKRSRNRAICFANGVNFNAHLELRSATHLGITSRQRDWVLQVIVKVLNVFEAKHASNSEHLLGMNILWVDDNLALKDRERIQLIETGCNLLTAESTMDGFSILKNQAVDAVITDLGRKGERLAGFQLAEFLLHELAPPPIPIALYSQSANNVAKLEWPKNMVACTDNFDEVLAALSSALANSKIEKPLEFKTLREWFDGIGFLKLPMPKRVELMTRLFCCVYRQNLGLAQTRSFALMVLARARIAATLVGNAVQSGAFAKALSELQNSEYSRYTLWDEGALFAVTVLLSCAHYERGEMDDAGSLVDEVAHFDGLYGAIEQFDTNSAPEFLSATLIELQAPVWRYHLSDLPRAWIAFEIGNRNLEGAISQALSIALSSFGFGAISEAKWFSRIMLPELQAEAAHLAAKRPWVLEVGFNLEPSKSISQITCATATDAKTVVRNLANFVITYDSNIAESHFSLDVRADFNSLINSLTRALANLSQSLEVSSATPAVFTHTADPVLLEREPFASIRNKLAMQGAFVLDGPMRSANARFNSLLIKLLDGADDVDSAASLSKETRAILVSTQSQAVYKRCYVQNRGMPIFAVTRDSEEGDLAEFARGMRNLAFPKSYEPVQHDTQKHRFGHFPTRNRRVLSGKVMELPVCPGWFVVDIEVNAPVHWPLSGKVRFYLDKTFDRNERDITSRENRAQLTEFAWGPFTVGATCDSGLTRLELDLADSLDSITWRDAKQKPEVKLNLAALELLLVPKSKFKRWVFPEQLQTQLDALSPEARAKTLKDTLELIQSHCTNAARFEDGVRARYRVDSKLAVKYASTVRAAVYVFLSHAKEDRDVAISIAQALESAGITVFIVAERLLQDTTMIKEINLALAECTHFVALVSAISLRSKFVVTEIETAILRHIRNQMKLVPVLIDEFQAEELANSFPLLASIRALRHQDKNFHDQLLQALVLPTRNDAPDVRSADDAEKFFSRES